MQDRAHGIAQQLKAHQENDDRDDETRNILQPPVAEWMLGVVESEWYEFQAIGADIVDENFITGISVEPGTDVAVIVAVPVNLL